MKKIKNKENIIDQARLFATQAHKRIDHRRKYSNQPYDVHLKAVADIVETVTDDPEMIAAAWLHDTIEDTPATFHDIEQAFGENISLLVSELTDVSKPSDGNRAVRKSIDRGHLSKASTKAKTIKLADIIDNCNDICKNDKRFARTYLSEMLLLMEVISEGNDRLFKRATKVIHACAKELKMPLATISNPVTITETETAASVFSQYRSQIIFTKAFTAKDIAEPLRSFGRNDKSSEVSSVMDEINVDVAGVLINGMVEGYIFKADLADRLCGDDIRDFREGQVLESEASLTDVIQSLTRHEYCFVSIRGSIFGVIDRSDIQKPVVRMWLFGIITLIEMIIVDRIQAERPNDSWKELISKSRLEKALTLFNERQRRNQRCNLMDCLQLSDKGKILIEDAQFLKMFGFKSKRAAKQVIKELESLRNNLAHVQNIVSHDWPQIARMTQRIESAFSNFK
jgi:hypothetical protein